MTTKSAIQVMLDGKKVNRKDFVEEVYAYKKGVFFNQYGMTIQGFGDNDEAWENYFIIEGEEEFFKTGGYDKQQVKLLDTYEVEI